jgi:hypothetical protein
LIIHELHATNMPSPPEAFDCAEIVRSNLFQVNIATNGALYAQQLDGELKLLATMRQDKSGGSRPPPTSVERATTYSLWGALNLTFFILATRMRVRNKKNKNKTQGNK